MSAGTGDTVATIAHTRALSDESTVSAFRLEVIEGPSARAWWVVDGTSPSRLFIGQSETCAIRLDDPAVSRRHAALTLVNDGLRLSDLDSTNGTFVDRVRIFDVLLSGDEHVRVGGSVLRVEALDGERPKAAWPAATKSFGRMVGDSLAMRRLYPLCERLAQSDVPVVIEGETGTGKEVLAESLHDAHPRRGGGPFVVFDCTAVPPTLLESELFGHERGAFTGAVASRPGVFEQAHGGTLLVDEIGDFDLTMQPKLLRALERSEVRRVGGQKWIKVDVRVFAATRRDLDREVQAGRFRDDLFHRIAVARIELPPLRERHGDVRLLAGHFAADLATGAAAIPEAVLARWDEREWTGNVRELRNAVARQLALGDLAAMLPEQRRAATAETAASDLAAGLLELPFLEARDALVERFEERYVARTLDRHHGDVARAAAASGIGRRYFQKLRAKHR